jgi:hypothetical protein
MEPTYFAQYRGFDFQCSPQRLGTQAFAPRLVIYDNSEPLMLEIPVDISAAPFEDPTAAAHHAFAFGRRWVDNGCDPAMFATRTEPTLRLTDSTSS